MADKTEEQKAEQEDSEEITELKDAIQELKDEIQAIEDREDTDGYDEWLDEVSGEVKIGSLTYSASQVLKAVDEIAYNCGYDDYVDSELSRLNDELEDKEQELKDLETEEQDDKETRQILEDAKKEQEKKQGGKA